MNQTLASQLAQGRIVGAAMGQVREDKSPTENVMQVLHLSIDRVEEQVRSLQQRLHSVMTPEHVTETPIMKVPADIPPPPSSALVEDLWAMDAQLSRISGLLGTLNNRLEV